MSPLRGWGDIVGVLVFPRLRRGLHDRARSAGFSERIPGAQPNIRDLLSPKGEADCSVRTRGVQHKVWDTLGHMQGDC